MNRVIARLRAIFTTIVFLGVSCTVLAQQGTLQAVSLPGVDKRIHDYYPLDENRIVYRKGPVNSDLSRSQFFVYDINLKKETFLFNTEYRAYNRRTEFWHAVSTGTKMYISVDGQLYLTEGSPKSSRLVYDFGTYFCCGIAATNSRLYPWTIRLMDGVAYFSVGGDISYYPENRQRPKSVTLWKSDGTTAGTRKVSEKFPYVGSGSVKASGLSKVFKNTAYNPSSLFYFGGNKLWEFSPGNAPRAINEFSSPVFFDSNFVTTDRGVFVCTDPNRDLGSDDQLWRFAPDGSLGVVAGGCGELVEFQGKLLMTRYDFQYQTRSLIESDGTPSSERRVSNLEVRYLRTGVWNEGFCKLGDSIFIEMWDRDENGEALTRLIEISESGLRDHTSVLTGGKVRYDLQILACSELGVTVYSKGNYLSDTREIGPEQFYVLKPDENKSYRIKKHELMGDDYERPGNRVSLMSNAVFVAGRGEPFFLQSVFPQVLPAVMSVLEEEVVETRAK